MRRVFVDPGAPQRDAIQEAAKWIANGGVVAIPTDTLYGLAADPFSAEAVARVFAVKGRPAARRQRSSMRRALARRSYAPAQLHGTRFRHGCTPDRTRVRGSAPRARGAGGIDRRARASPRSGAIPRRARGPGRGGRRRS